MLLIDKPNESCQNFKKIKRNAISTTKKLLKRKRNSITQAKTNAPISQTSSEGLKLIIQTYQMRNKELKMNLANFKRKYQKHLCQLVLIYVTTLNQLLWKLTKEKCTLHEVNFGGTVKISTVFYQ